MNRLCLLTFFVLAISATSAFSQAHFVDPGETNYFKPQNPKPIYWEYKEQKAPALPKIPGQKNPFPNYNRTQHTLQLNRTPRITTEADYAKPDTSWYQ